MWIRLIHKKSAFWRHKPSRFNQQDLMTRGSLTYFSVDIRKWKEELDKELLVAAIYSARSSKILTALFQQRHQPKMNSNDAKETASILSVSCPTSLRCADTSLTFFFASAFFSIFFCLCSLSPFNVFA